jgi:malate synthase
MADRMYQPRNVETLSRVTLSSALSLGDREILTPEAIEFLAILQAEFGDRRKKLVARRSLVQHEIDMGYLPCFDESSRSVRANAWHVRIAPPDLADRRVEVTVPAGDPVRAIEALNSGANVCVLDFEDTLSPAWTTILSGQRTVRAVARGELSALTPEGRRHALAPAPAVMMIRPRGLHLLEKHFCVDGEPMSATLFDAGLFLFHNGAGLLARGSGPYLTIPKIENRFEAALWDDILRFAEERLGLPPASVRVTVLIETILAAFEMDEILFELRDRSVGLACDHRDTMFSFVKKFSKYPGCILPDIQGGRARGGFFRSIEILMIQACHRRGTYAIGSTSASIPSSNDREAREAVRESVRWEMEAEARAGFDGTCVAYPALVRVARDAFDAIVPSGNQLGRLRTDVTINRDDMLAIPQGTASEAGLRDGIDVGVRYLESWLSGSGSVPLRGYLEDVAGAELARAGVWQWMTHGVRLEGGSVLTPELFRRVFSEEMERISAAVGPERYRRGQFELASRLFFNCVHDPEFTPFFTLKAYQHL